jgi:uncharacterized protein (TIGR03437 family)
MNTAGSALSYAALFAANTVAAALALDSSGIIHFAGSAGIVGTLTPSQSSAARIFGVASAAGGLLAGRVAPGEVISIYGLNFGVAPTAATFDSSGFLPTALAGVQVTINGAPAPLMYVSGTQINAVTPFELVSASTASLSITVSGSPLPTFLLAVDPQIPAVFNGVLNQDGTFNSLSNPAKIGSFVSVWATGLGWVFGLADGQMATAAQDFHCCEIHEYANQYITPAYAGAAPGLVNGIVQINFQVSSAQAYSIAINGRESSVFSIAVTR